MTTLGLLYLLGATLSVCVGMRDGLGRCCLINKRAYLFRAIGRGVLAGHLGLALVGLIGGALWSLSPTPDALMAQTLEAGRAALFVYLGFTAAVVATFGLYAFPSPETRSLTSVAVFGPLTLMQTPVVFAGVLAAWLTVPTWETLVFFGGAGVVMTALEPALDRGGWSRRDAARLLEGRQGLEGAASARH